MMQPTSNVLCFLGVSTSIPNTFVGSHVISPTTLTPIKITFTCPSYTYTPPTYSPPTQNTSNEPLINHVMQTISSLQQQVSTMNQKNHGIPTYFVNISLFSLDFSC
jgi:hypothetical protein